ncbi:MAG: folate family ECF transporter S component [Clostridia bacterium]|nr:folate family ECF transporter S component [Clostridia bacterium]
MKKEKTKKSALFKIILTAILIALNVILERLLAYSVWNQTISFGFIVVAFAAAFLGTPYAVAVAGFGDIIGSVLLPFGPYFPGFTATNCIYALILAEFIYKNATPVKCILSVVATKLVCSLTLNTLWVSILYRGGVDAFFPVLITRLPQTAIMTVVEIFVLLLVFSSKSKIRQTLQKNITKFL